MEILFLYLAHLHGGDRLLSAPCGIIFAFRTMSVSGVITKTDKI